MTTHAHLLSIQSKQKVTSRHFYPNAPTVLTARQYDDECTEVDAYRQKQVYRTLFFCHTV